MGWQGWRTPPLGRLSEAQPVMELMSAGRILIQYPDDFASHEPGERGRWEIRGMKDFHFNTIIQIVPSIPAEKCLRLDYRIIIKSTPNLGLHSAYSTDTAQQQNNQQI